MSELGDKIATMTIDRLKESGNAFWDNLDDVRKDQVIRTVKRLAKGRMELLTKDDGEDDIRREEIQALEGTLLDESALVAMDAWNRILSTMAGIVKGLIGILL